MDAIEAVHSVLVSAESIPLAFYKQYYKGSAGGFGVWVWKVNRAIQAKYGVKLRKQRDVYVPMNAKQQLRSGDKHGRKALNQKRYQIDTYDGLMVRPDAPEEIKVAALTSRDKAASSLADMSTKRRLRDRISKLLEGK